jgi:hypothetical protein
MMPSELRTVLEQAIATGRMSVGHTLRQLAAAGGVHAEPDVRASHRDGAGTADRRRLEAFARAAERRSLSTEPAQAPRTTTQRRNSSRVAINKLPSGAKIDKTHSPEASIDDLDPLELTALLHALGLARPDEEAQGRDTRKARAKDLLDTFRLEAPTILGSPWTISGSHGWRLRCHLTEEVYEKLQAAAAVAHCSMRVTQTGAGRHGQPKLRLAIGFNGTEDRQDLRQHLKTAVGGVGAVYKATREIAAILADTIRELGAHVEIGFVCGISLGGGAAQAFLASLESRIRLPAPPPLILLDPQLLNNAQARHATRHGEHPYDFEKPRGIAITLDYRKEPRRGLMGLMKGPGRYKYPGLLQLKLGLQDTDGPGAEFRNGMSPLVRSMMGLRDGGSPRPLAWPPGLGYHGPWDQYEQALRRFTGQPEATPAHSLPGSPASQGDSPRSAAPWLQSLVNPRK